MKPPVYVQAAELLFRAAQDMGLEPVWLDYGLFSVQAGGARRYVYYSASLMNSQLAQALAVNKYATRLILQEHSFPNIPFLLPDSYEAAKAFIEEHKVVVVKPIKGLKSLEVTIIRSADEVARDTLDSTYIYEKFIQGTEMRVLILNGKVLAVHAREYPGPINNDPSKVNRVSYEPSEWDGRMVETALAVTEVMGLRFAAVDFIQTDEGFVVLEVNSAPELRRFEKPDEGPAIPAARLFLEAMMKEWSK
jgi:glutathione synthase/RimK-type ligase-like ATP-grasp enzyme